MKKIGGSAFKVSVAVAIVVCIWIYNVAFNVPIFMWANVHLGWSAIYICYPTASPVYVLAARIINFYVPLAITWTSYISIIYKFKRSMNKAGYFLLIMKLASLQPTLKARVVSLKSQKS